MKSVSHETMSIDAANATRLKSLVRKKIPIVINVVNLPAYTVQRHDQSQL